MRAASTASRGALRSALRRRSLHTLKPLPYAADALAPHLSSKAIELHRAAEADLVAQLNTAIAGTEFEHAALPELVAATSADAAHARVGNLASEVWNHELYWARLAPSPEATPPEQLQQWLEPEFGSFDGFVDRFASRARALWGSGWTWLVLDGALTPRVVNSFAGCHPLSAGMTPILAIDLWEHAWVLDYPGGRDAYVRALLAHAVDWAAVSDALVAAANGAPESAKLRHLVSLSAADMKKLRSVVIDHGTLDLSEDLSLSKLHLLGAADPAADAGAGAAVHEAAAAVARAPPASSVAEGEADAAAKS